MSKTELDGMMKMLLVLMRMRNSWLDEERPSVETGIKSTLGHVTRHTTDNGASTPKSFHGNEMITDFRPLNVFPRTFRRPSSFLTLQFARFVVQFIQGLSGSRTVAKKTPSLLNPKEAKLQRPPGRI
jgi:hypothetical protein